jgi:alkylation response protein AidB-like acyl-CoA dehydrogenase
MDYGLVDLTPKQAAFAAEVRALLDAVVTDEVIEHERRSGDGFSESVYMAMGERGWLYPTWPVERGGAGLDQVEARIIELELERHHLPDILSGTTRGSWMAVEAFGHPDIRDALRPGVARGTVRICLGYTEPDGGSDVAAAKLRAVPTENGWTLNGAKMFTTAAHLATHCFLLTRTNLQAPKHRGLTMFLVPMDTPGVSVQAIRTYGGERTNATYFGDVQIEDIWRLGPVDGGWSVLMVPLSNEHGTDGKETPLLDPSYGRHYLRPLEEALDAVIVWAQTAMRPDGTTLWSDPAVRICVGQIATDVEAAVSAPAAAGRILGAEVLARGAANLMDLIGPEALIPAGQHGAIAGGGVEFAHRFAQGTLTYGGSVEVFRSMLAQELGLPRPRYPDETAR